MSWLFAADELALCIRWPKYWSFSFSFSPSSEYSGLISFSMDWLDLFHIQETLKSLLQHHSLKASVLWCSAFFMVQCSFHWKRFWCWERLKAGGEEKRREWDGGMASLTQWAWTWMNSGRQWRTGQPGVLQSMGCKSRTYLVTEQQSYTIFLASLSSGPSDGLALLQATERKEFSSSPRIT